MKKFVLVLCVLAMVLSQGVCAFAATNIESESNDSISTADYVDLRNTDTEFIYGTIGPNDTSDFFEIHPRQLGNGVFKLEIYDDSKDYDLFLYHQSGKLATSSQFNAGSDERIDYGIQSNTIYYLEVRYISGGYANEPYRLRLDLN